VEEQIGRGVLTTQLVRWQEASKPHVGPMLADRALDGALLMGRP
jgi:hypothetical protein